MKVTGNMQDLINAWVRAFDRREVVNGRWLYRSTHRPIISIHNYPHSLTRLTARLFKPDFDPKLFACHVCDNPRCFRPSHLFMGTQKQNIADAVAKRRMVKLQKNHCPSGHEFTPENTKLHPYGDVFHRCCFTCIKAHNDARPRKTLQKRNRKSKAYYNSLKGSGL